MKAREFARSIISGPGGFKDWIDREVIAIDPGTDLEREAIALWTMRCLANTDCDGSEQAVAAILSRRMGLSAKEYE